MMQTADFIRNGAAKLIGITGGAGSGKSTLADLLELPTYHIDSAFIGDSDYRKKLLLEKKDRSASSYMDMEAQYNWWNWERVEDCVLHMKRCKKKCIVEGAILGPPFIVSQLDVIIYIDIPYQERLKRLLLRDKGKRTSAEIMDRFVLTNKSEEQYYEYLNKYHSEKIYRIDKEYNFI